ncbi:hypothetical protein TNCV_2171551 [Trichonephila clavipes]|nr:hypothetical protein TNCV_2171551 [Trichonephila clavipes]
MWPVIVLPKYRVGSNLQQGQKNRLHNMYDVAVYFQTAINVYQKHPVIKYYTIPNHDIRCRSSLKLIEMDWFVVFSWSPPYPSTAAIPPQTKTKLMREQNPVHLGVAFRVTTTTTTYNIIIIINSNL